MKTGPSQPELMSLWRERWMEVAVVTQAGVKIPHAGIRKFIISSADAHSAHCPSHLMILSDMCPLVAELMSLPCVLRWGTLWQSLLSSWRRSVLSPCVHSRTSVMKTWSPKNCLIKSVRQRTHMDWTSSICPCFTFCLWFFPSILVYLLKPCSDSTLWLLTSVYQPDWISPSFLVLFMLFPPPPSPSPALPPSLPVTSGWSVSVVFTHCGPGVT